MSRRSVVDAVMFVVVVVIGWWAVANQQDIRDWWILRTYSPPSEIVALAETTAMTKQAKRVFYANRPELNDRTNFNTNCPFPDRSLVLGCFADNHIYIFKVSDAKLDGVEEVTAAHELLHAAYARMSSSERNRVDQLTTDAYTALNDERLNDTIKGYQQDDPDSVPNELHSILGTEFRELPAELETHYANYFSDRSKVVTIAESYEKVFVQLQSKIAQLAQQIAALKSQIAQTEVKLTSDKLKLDAEAKRLQDLRNASQFEAYNTGVPGYNAQVNAYNSLVEEYKSLVSRHNKLVEEHNELALEQNHLVQSLNSKFQPIE